MNQTIKPLLSHSTDTEDPEHSIIQQWHLIFITIISTILLLYYIYSVFNALQNSLSFSPPTFIFGLLFL